MVLGQCNCGEVAFKIYDDISDVYICHCSICRKSTGSNGIAVFVVDNESFQWMLGEEQVLTWKQTIGIGKLSSVGCVAQPYQVSKTNQVFMFLLG